MAEQNDTAARVLAVYKQLEQGAGGVDANKLFDAAVNLVSDEVHREAYLAANKGEAGPPSDPSTAAREAAAEIEANG